MLIVVAAFAILVAMLYLPTLRIYGKSMKGMLDSGDVVLTVKSNHFRTGDIVVFLLQQQYFGKTSYCRIG